MLHAWESVKLEVDLMYQVSEAKVNCLDSYLISDIWSLLIIMTFLILMLITRDT